VRVAIVGAGIGGCALALSLEAAGITDVVLHEAAPEVRELGVGINVLPHAARELTELGLGEQLDAIAVRTAELSYHNRLGQLIWHEQRGVNAGYRWPQWSIHRGMLLGVLYRAVLERLGPDAVRTGARLEPADVAALDADVVVGADGVHSAARRLLQPDEGPPLWNGVTMWRGVTPMEPFLGGRRMVMAGVIRRRMVIYPIHDLPDGRQLVNWVAVIATDDGRPMPAQDWSASADAAEALHEVRDIRLDLVDVEALISGCDEVLKYPMVDREPLTTWRRGNLTLLGDAAHPMYPNGSNGASQAVIDARILARELATRTSVDEALDAYEQLRIPATTAVVLSNRQAGPERLLDMVGERAPDGFERLEDVISPDELAAVVDDYQKMAGFAPQLLNERESFSVTR
jgi:2-polyprenyl-6-methoxyphenol hydroxylase-like FAD-dependent oxidoreductase